MNPYLETLLNPIKTNELLFANDTVVSSLMNGVLIA